MFIPDFRVHSNRCYENLLKTREPGTSEETQIECKIEEEIQQITNRQGDKKEELQKS